MKPTVLVLMLIACGACGDDASSAPDSALPDGPNDSLPPGMDSLACTPRGAPGPVTIDGPSGSAGLQVTVLVHDQSGAIVSRSSALGPNATLVVDAPSCGMVSVHDVDPAGTGDSSIFTWANVQPGDHLIHTSNQLDFVDREIQLEVAAHPGATTYEVMAVCPRYGLPLTDTVRVGVVRTTAHCLPGAQSVSVIVVATAPTGAAFALVADAPLAPSGTTVVPLPPYQASTQTVAATVRNAESFAGGDGSLGLFALPAAERALVVGQRLTRLGAMPSVGPIPTVAGTGGAAFLSLRTAAGAVPDRLMTLLRPFATFPAAIELDLATDFLPALDATLGGDATRPSVTWTASRPPSADFALLLLEIPVGASHAVHWTFVTPPRPGTARVPAIPPDLLPPGTPRLQAISLTEATSIDSYDAARGQLATLRLPPSATNEVRGSVAIYPAPR